MADPARKKSRLKMSGAVPRRRVRQQPRVDRQQRDDGNSRPQRLDKQVAGGTEEGVKSGEETPQGGVPGSVDEAINSSESSRRYRQIGG